MRKTKSDSESVIGSLSRRDRGITFGMVLGDGCIRVRSRIKLPEGYRWTTQEFRIKHSHTQKAYIEHKATLVKKIFGGDFNVKPTYVRLHGERHEQYLFAKSHMYFRHLYGLFYPNGKKKITIDVLNHLTPHGLAIWYMDDGNVNINRNKDGWVSSCVTIISTCCSLQEAKVIRRWFWDRYGIGVTVFAARENQYSIRMDTANSKKFVRIIKPYIIPSMQYKLEHVANLNNRQSRPPAMQCIECGEDIYECRRRMMCARCYTAKFSNWDMRMGRIPKPGRANKST